MNAVEVPGTKVVAKKKPTPTPSEENERVEFQAPPGFTAEVDEAARLEGLSRSAYIRRAVLKQMRADRREREQDKDT